MIFQTHRTLNPASPEPITCCCFHPTRPHLYLATGTRILEYDLVSGEVLGARSEELEVTDLHCSDACNCVVALLQDQYVRVYKELALHGGNGLRPVLKHRCAGGRSREESVGPSALCQGSRATFYFGKKGRANVYAIDAFAEESACEIVKVPGAKKALRTEPLELICHPTKPLFVAVSESVAIVGSTAQMSFALEGSGSSSGRLHSLSFHPTLARMLGIRGSEILCWDVSNSAGFRLLASVQAAAPVDGVYFLPGASPYFCSFSAGDAGGDGAPRFEVSPWYLDESNEEQPLQKSAAMNTSTLTELATHYCSMQSAAAPVKWPLFPHSVLPVVVATAPRSFVVVRCTDRFCPTTVVPTAAAMHLSLEMLEAQLTEPEPDLPAKLHFMNGCSLWTYDIAEGLCEEVDGTLTLPNTATVCSTLERHSGPDGEVILATACMEFGGGTRAAFFTASPGAETRQRGCRDAALVGVTHWPDPPGSTGAVAAVISEDGMNLTFEGRQAEVAGCGGPHSLGSSVSRLFSTPFGNGMALLYVDAANNLRFSRNRGSSDGLRGAVGSDWTVWEDGPGLRLHGDESVVSAAWQEGSPITGQRWLPVLALVTSRRVMLLSGNLEVMALAEVEAGTTAPLGVPSGIWCGVVFLYSTPAQIRWLALDGTSGGLVSLPALNATLCGVTQRSVIVLCPDGHRSFVHAIPVALYEPLALGWIVASQIGQVSLATAVGQIQTLANTRDSEWTVSAVLLSAIAVLPDAVSSPEDEAARQSLLQIGLSTAFSKRTGIQFPLGIRLTLALRCGAYELGYEALRQEWIRQSEPSLSATSALGQLFERLAAACRAGGQPEIARQCRSVLCNQWDPLHGSAGAMARPAADEAPKTFADVLAMQASRLPSGTLLEPSDDTLPSPVPLALPLPLPGSAMAAEGRRNWESMAGVRVQAHAAGGLNRRGSSPDSSLQLDMDADGYGHGGFDIAVPTMSNSTTTSGSQFAYNGASPARGDDSDDEGADGVGGLQGAGWNIDKFSSSDDDDDEDGGGGRARRITIEIKQPSSTVSRSSVSAILQGATSVPISVGGSPGDTGSARTSSRLAAPPRTASLLAPPPRTVSMIAPPPPSTLSKPQ